MFKCQDLKIHRQFLKKWTNAENLRNFPRKCFYLIGGQHYSTRKKYYNFLKYSIWGFDQVSQNLIDYFSRRFGVIMVYHEFHPLQPAADSEWTKAIYFPSNCSHCLKGISGQLPTPGRGEFSGLPSCIEII
jgi:hypothetical protein